MDTEKIEEVLAHYGVTGMKWGVRRKGRSGGKASADYTRSRKLLKKKKLSELSNDDLKKLNKRLEMERKFKAVNPKASAEGKRWVGKTLNAYGNLAVGAIAGAASAATVAKLLRS